jgi:hypothetical protein
VERSDEPEVTQGVKQARILDAGDSKGEVALAGSNTSAHFVARSRPSRWVLSATPTAREGAQVP